MYQSACSFVAPLQPKDYFGEETHLREQSRVFEATWQMVGLASSISRPGQYLTTTIGRTPVLVRNCDGMLTALLNVCSHRHCTLATAALGHSEKLKCPFHGWEFGADGRTRKIPAARNFPDFDRERYRLPVFQVETCGDLLFVRVQRDGPTLVEWLGSLSEELTRWTDPGAWHPARPRVLSFPANWKIPVEASLESYHIPEVHAQTFAEDPGEAKSDHAFFEHGSSFFTMFNTPRFRDKLLKVWEQSILRVLGVPFTGQYEHHHLLPNLLVSHTDSLTLVQTVSPASPVTSQSVIWHFGRRSARGNPVSRITANLWGRFTSWLAFQVLQEDIRMYPRVQRGAAAAGDRAILGRCEERLALFQRFVAESLQ